MAVWSGLSHREASAEHGPIFDAATGLFSRAAPGGEWYDAVAHRLRTWMEETAEEAGDRLVIMHGQSSRVLRGLMTGLPDRSECGAPIADALPQGLVAVIENGVETLLHLGSGRSRGRSPA